MKTLYSFINESEELSRIIKTDSNAKRRELLKEYLKGRYTDYLDKLEEMCADPKARVLLDDAFGGEIGDVELSFSEESIPVRRLMPTQNEVCLESSFRHIFKSGGVSVSFEEPVEIISPIITFNKSYVIDGHHRWSQIMCTNPAAKATCINYDGDLSIIQMLKATQGAIAAAVNEIPKSKGTGKNIYNCSEKEIREYIRKNITDNTVKELSRYVSEIKTVDEAEDYLYACCLELVSNHPVIYDAPERSEMPQTDKGGGLKPDGALTKMKDGKVLKV